MSESGAREIDRARHRLYVEGSITPRAYAAVLMRSAREETQARSAAGAGRDLLLVGVSLMAGALLMLVAVIALRL